MLYGLARLMQLAGLVALPLAVSGNVAGELTLKTSLSLSGIGMLIFFAGWLLQQSVKKP